MSVQTFCVGIPMHACAAAVKMAFSDEETPHRRGTHHRLSLRTVICAYAHVYVYMFLRIYDVPCDDSRRTVETYARGDPGVIFHPERAPYMSNMKPISSGVYNLLAS